MAKKLGTGGLLDSGFEPCTYEKPSWEIPTRRSYFSGEVVGSLWNFLLGGFLPSMSGFSGEAVGLVNLRLFYHYMYGPRDPRFTPWFTRTYPIDDSAAVVTSWDILHVHLATRRRPWQQGGSTQTDRVAMLSRLLDRHSPTCMYCVLHP